LALRHALPLVLVGKTFVKRQYDVSPPHNSVGSESRHLRWWPE
jgi:hypothetical protein